MEFIQLGSTSIKVSRYCIGSWQASGWVSSDDKKFVNGVRCALDAGVNFIDTAEGYGNGHSEKLLSRAIGSKRHSLVLASKFSHTHSAPLQIRQALEGSLKRLNTDYIDLYQQHWPGKKPALAETIGELELLKKEGKIRAIGVSNWSELEWAEISNPRAIDCMQICYNILWRVAEAKVLPLAHQHTIGCMAYSPLCQGLLSGRFRTLESVPPDSRRANHLTKEGRFTKVLEVLKCLDQIGMHHNKTPTQVALRWLLQQSAVTSVIVGASAPQQVEENLSIFDWELSEPELKSISQISLNLSSDLKPHDSLWDWHPRN